MIAAISDRAFGEIVVACFFCWLGLCVVIDGCVRRWRR